ncbi:D-alanine--D-alanine ligase [Candidatus Orientia mediorientalis]|uniref:D-alanine--D-alanine ligase n=1 Tax=Candidatus Orientia mediorientalis TaxID=911112 RepID=UPI0005F815E9|nr:D-alanine--D-alanine ligase [Candidatus Orientia mediorientalis]
METKAHNLQSRNSIVEIITNSGKKHIVILYGGGSAEREVSLMSNDNVQAALIANGYQITRIDVGQDIAIKLAEIKRPYVVFNCLIGTYGEDGCIPGLLNIMNIPYTHSGVKTSATAFDKQIAKTILQFHGIKTPAWVIVSSTDNIVDDPIPRPYVIKPLQQGSSIGVKIMRTEDTFLFKDYNFQFGNKVLVEKYIKGRELQVALLDGKVLGILEIKMLKNKIFYDYQSKYNAGFAEHVMPPILSASITSQIISIAEKVYKIFDCRGPCRLECILSDIDNEVYVIELNTHPGMTSLSSYPEIAQYRGISFNTLIEKILMTAQYD